MISSKDTPQKIIETNFCESQIVTHQMNNLLQKGNNIFPFFEHMDATKHGDSGAYDINKWFWHQMKGCF